VGLRQFQDRFSSALGRASWISLALPAYQLVALLGQGRPGASERRPPDPLPRVGDGDSLLSMFDRHARNGETCRSAGGRRRRPARNTWNRPTSHTLAPWLTHFRPGQRNAAPHPSRYVGDIARARPASHRHPRAIDRTSTSRGDPNRLATRVAAAGVNHSPGSAGLAVPCEAASLLKSAAHPTHENKAHGSATIVTTSPTPTIASQTPTTIR
jgi:hypothetical protein